MHTLSARQIHETFLRGEATAEEITRVFLRRIEASNKDLGAFLDVFHEEALEKARLLDHKKQSGKKIGRLAAVPIAIKDNIQVKGKPTTCGSKILENYISPYTASAVENLLDEDAIILGKTNLDEFGMGSSTEYSAFFPAKNPWDLSRSPGGSSGGSSAAVAARLCPIALGSDTGGSIRQPASFTGTVGFKPSYGRVSRYGLIAYGSSLDVIGPFGTCVEDVALSMEAMGRPCPKDSTSRKEPPHPYLDSLSLSIRGKKIGVPWDFMSELTGHGLVLFKEGVQTLRELGCEIVDIELPLLKHSLPVYYILSTAEASTNLARFDGIRYGKRAEATNLDDIYDLTRRDGFGMEVRQRIMLGTFVLSSEHQEEFYRKAQRVRTRIIQNFTQAFAKCDAILTPTSPNEAFAQNSISDPVTMYLQDLYTIGANLAGLPAISVPCGHFPGNLPFGIQLIGRQGHDDALLTLAYQFEQERKCTPTIPDRYLKEIR